MNYCSGYASAQTALSVADLGSEKDRHGAVWNWVRKLSTNIMYKWNMWHNDIQSYIARGFECLSNIPADVLETFGRRFSYEVLVVEADGTNTAAAQGSKTHNCWLSTYYMFDPLTEVLAECLPEDAVPEAPQVPGGRQECSGFCDLLRIPQSCGGAEVYKMLKKQMSGTGARTWLSVIPKAIYRTVDALPRAWIFMHLMVIIFQSDQGPDQTAADKLGKEDDVEQDLFKLHFRSYCLQHSLHLIVKGHLVLLEFVAHSKYFPVWLRLSTRGELAGGQSGLKRRGSVYARLHKNGLTSSSRTCPIDLCEAGGAQPIMLRRTFSEQDQRTCLRRGTRP